MNNLGLSREKEIIENNKILIEKLAEKDLEILNLQKEIQEYDKLFKHANTRLFQAQELIMNMKCRMEDGKTHNDNLKLENEKLKKEIKKIKDRG